MEEKKVVVSYSTKYLILLHTEHPKQNFTKKFFINS